MAIIQTVDYSDFRDAFKRMGRENQFQNLECLYDYLKELYDSTGDNYELDVIALCCEYSEESWEDVAYTYGIDLPEIDKGEDESEHRERVREAILEYLNEHTSVCGYDDDSVMYAQF